MKKNFRLGFSTLLPIIPLTAFSYLSDGENLLKIPLYFYASFYFSLGTGAMTIYTLNVYFRLATIEQILQLKLDKKLNQKFIKAEKDNEKVLITLSDTYSDLLDCCDDVNLCFGLGMMLSFGLVFFYTLFIVFTVYTDILNEKTLSPITATSVGFCFYYNLFLTSVIFTCTRVEEKVSYY